MISTFGPKVRGISPYSDSLCSSIDSLNSIHLERIDYIKAFPNFLLPKNTDYRACNDYAHINYTKPSTWDITNGKMYDIAHIQYWSPAFLPIIFAVLQKIKKRSIKAIITWHNPSPHENFPLLRLAEKKLLSMCDSVICHTEAGAQILNSTAPNKSVNVIHHGCEASNVSVPSQKDYEVCNLSDGYNYVLYFGNIRPYKGVDMLLDAWERLPSLHSKTKLIIAGRLWENKKSILSKLTHRASGTTSYSDLIKHKSSKQQDSVITDFQFIPQDKLLSYIHVSKLAVFPYLSFESQSGAASLAAGHGLPIIATSVGGLKELAISNEFISQDLSADSFSKLIHKHLNNSDKNLKSQQVEIAKQLSWELSAEKHILDYKDVANN